MMPPDGWVPTANRTAQNRRLSWRAKGLLTDLLSFPDGYNITFDKLMAMAKAAGDPDVEGRDAMRKSMQELERKGYLAHRRVAVPNAAPGRQRWVTETAICDLPIFAGGAGDTAFQYPQGSVPPDFSTSNDQEVINNTGFNKKNNQQDEHGKSSSSLAAAREGQQASSQDRLRSDLQGWYDAADKLDNDRLRRHLLAFERKRPQVYRDKRQRALAQLGREDPEILKSKDAVRATDLLSFKYALLHYVDRMPDWLIRLPG